MPNEPRRRILAQPLDAPPEYRPVLCRFGVSEEPIRLFIRALTPDENRDLRDRHMRVTRKLKSLRNETIGQWERKAEAIAHEKAALALGGSEDFSITLPEEKRAAFTEETGVAFDENGDALLPRTWSEGLKSRVFKARPQLVDFICVKTDEAGNIEEADEAEETASFR